MTSAITDNPVVRLLNLWQRLHHLPGGAWLFSRMPGRVIPYTGSIGANVKEFKPGYARIQMRDRRRVRNHLLIRTLVSGESDFEVHSDIVDLQGDVVARTTVIWRLGPIPENQ